jgi:hypothetical protein
MNFKKIISLFVFMICVSGVVNAGYVDDLKQKSWSELRADWDLDFEGDQIWFRGRVISIFDTCMVSNTIIRTKKRVIIEEYDGEDFYATGNDYLYRSLIGTRTIVEGDGTSSEEYTLNKTRKIRVVQNDDEFSGEILFYKEFTVPKCKKI